MIEEEKAEDEKEEEQEEEQEVEEAFIAADNEFNEVKTGKFIYLTKKEQYAMVKSRQAQDEDIYECILKNKNPQDRSGAGDETSYLMLLPLNIQN